MSFRKILSSLRKADTDYQMISDGDRICVGVSGGKDSVLLLYALEQYRRVKQHYDHCDFSVIGIHLNMGFEGEDISPLSAYFKEHGIELISVDTDLYETLLHYPKNNGNLSCSRCSALRKGALTNAAAQYQCNKIALGHHGDDAVETLLMNMIHGSRISVFEPVSHLSYSGMDMIRPMIYVFEEEIRKAVEEELQIPVVKSGCPNNDRTARSAAGDILQMICDQYPNARKNMLSSLSNTDNVSLWKKLKR